MFNAINVFLTSVLHNLLRGVWTGYCINEAYSKALSRNYLSDLTSRHLMGKLCIIDVQTCDKE